MTRQESEQELIRQMLEAIRNKPAIDRFYGNYGNTGDAVCDWGKDTCLSAYIGGGPAYDELRNYAYGYCSSYTQEQIIDAPKYWLKGAILNAIDCHSYKAEDDDRSFLDFIGSSLGGRLDSDDPHNM
tara:strand:+ start:148 stop:528 length:381 start_codon:yes stop_codon:yes gene_type:complete